MKNFTITSILLIRVQLIQGHSLFKSFIFSIFFTYNIKSKESIGLILMKSSDFEQRKNWSQKEDQALKALVQRQGLNQEKEYDQRVLEQYGLTNRSAKECFNRRHEHLSQEINQQGWTQKQIQRLFEAHEKYGNKWKEISKHLKDRTENEIKNKFYSTIRKRLRKISKRAGIKNSTSIIRQLKPHLLSQFLSSIQVQNPELFKLVATSSDYIEEHPIEAVKIREKELLKKLNELCEEQQNIQREKKQFKEDKSMRMTRSNRSKIEKEPRINQKKISISEEANLEGEDNQDSSSNLDKGSDKLNFDLEDLNMDFYFNQNQPFPQTEIIAKNSNKQVEMNDIFQKFEIDSPVINFSTPFRPSPSPRWGGIQYDGVKDSFSKENLDHYLEETRKRLNNNK